MTDCSSETYLMHMRVTVCFIIFSYIPTETICFDCKTPLTEPYCVTRNAKLVTLKGIVEGKGT